MSANDERGELAITLEGEIYGMRPSYEAIQSFEAATGKGLIQLTRDALAGTMTLGEAAQIVAECVRAWGREHDKADVAKFRTPRIAQLIVESDGGLHGTLGNIAGMLSMAATGGCTASGEAKAAAVTTKTRKGRKTDEAPAAD